MYLLISMRSRLTPAPASNPEPEETEKRREVLTRAELEALFSRELQRTEGLRIA